jgi:hypothetical protein
LGKNIEDNGRVRNEFPTVPYYSPDTD